MRYPPKPSRGDAVAVLVVAVIVQGRNEARKEEEAAEAAPSEPSDPED